MTLPPFIFSLLLKSATLYFFQLLYHFVCQRLTLTQLTPFFIVYGLPIYIPNINFYYFSFNIQFALYLFLNYKRIGAVQMLKKGILRLGLVRFHNYFLASQLQHRNIFFTSLLKQTSEAEGIEQFIKSKKTIEKLKMKGIQDLFPIQKRTFNQIYSGRDVIAGDKTGSGKTIAFCLPVIEKMRHENLFNRQNEGLKFVILAPTRQLAMQITNELLSLKNNYHEFKVFTAYGGSQIRGNQMALRKNPDILVGTPGRILDLISRDWLNFKNVSAVCVDQADYMFDIGFKQHIQKILNNISSSTQRPCQFLCFTATLNNEVANITSKFMKKNKAVVKINNEGQGKTPVEITHASIIVNKFGKTKYIQEIIQKFSNRGRVIIFTNTKISANELGDNISASNVVLHGDIQQRKRFQRLNAFKSGHVNVLIATDVAARGLDIPNVELVINYDAPQKVEAYVHRSGRTGRAGKTGTCITLFQDFIQEKQLKRQVRQKYNIQMKGTKQIIGLTKQMSEQNKKQSQQSQQALKASFEVNQNEYIQNQYILFDRKDVLSKSIINQALAKEGLKGQIVQVNNMEKSGSKFFIFKASEDCSPEEILPLRVGESKARFQRKKRQIKRQPTY